jgi:RES domain
MWSADGRAVSLINTQPSAAARGGGWRGTNRIACTGSPASLLWQGTTSAMPKPQRVGYGGRIALSGAIRRSSRLIGNSGYAQWKRAWTHRLRRRQLTRVYRILRKPYSKPLHGQGTYRFGDRWSSARTRIAYTAEHLSLAMIEYSIHIEADDPPRDLVVVTAEVPQSASRISVSSK